MTREQALQLFNDIPNGSYPYRNWYASKFPVGEVARACWNDPMFTYGIEYGMLIALAQAFDITPEELGFDTDGIDSLNRIVGYALSDSQDGFVYFRGR